MDSDTRWVEWIEPYGPNDEPVYCRVPFSTAAAVQKKVAASTRRKYVYKSDEAAFEDFVIGHWGTVINKTED